MLSSTGDDNHVQTGTTSRQFILPLLGQMIRCNHQIGSTLQTWAIEHSYTNTHNLADTIPTACITRMDMQQLQRRLAGLYTVVLIVQQLFSSHWYDELRWLSGGGNGVVCSIASSDWHRVKVSMVSPLVTWAITSHNPKSQRCDPNMFGAPYLTTMHDRHIVTIDHLRNPDMASPWTQRSRSWSQKNIRLQSRSIFP